MWRKAVRRIWHLPWKARSLILPSLIQKDSFLDQLYKRFLKLYWSVADNENSTVKLICNVAKHGIIDGNFHEISKQWRYPECHLRRKLQFRGQRPKSVIDNNRAQQIRDLTKCLEGSFHLPNFTMDDIKSLIYLISTY